MEVYKSLSKTQHTLIKSLVDQSRFNLEINDLDLSASIFTIPKKINLEIVNESEWDDDEKWKNESGVKHLIRLGNS